VIVVEGYMDVVALAQHDIGYAVATLGTATTPTHVQKLLRQAGDIVFCFDGDDAGRRAAWRALENSLEHLADGKQLSFLFLPQGEDPDSYVRKLGREAFEKLLNDAQPLSQFLLRELSSRVDVATHEGRARLLQEAAAADQAGRRAAAVAHAAQAACGARRHQPGRAGELYQIKNAAQNACAAQSRAKNRDIAAAQADGARDGRPGAGGKRRCCDAGRRAARERTFPASSSGLFNSSWGCCKAGSPSRAGSSISGIRSSQACLRN
jgi:DNA primase